MYCQSENPHGGDLYTNPGALDFSVSVNPLGAPPAARDAIVRAAELIQHYPDPFCRELTAALARYEGVPESYILCGNGAAELIFSFCAALKPRRALVPAPAFSEYEAALDAAGCEVLRFPLSPEEGFLLSGAFPAALARSGADLAVLCNPNNPTGRLIPRETLEETLRVCRARGVRLLVDECFLDLSDGVGALSLRDRLAEYPGLFLLRALTKSFGLAGARLGYGLCADPALLDAMARTRQPWSVSLPAQLAGTAALEDGSFLPRARVLIRGQRPVLSRGLAALGLRPVPSEANFILFQSARALKAPLLERGVLIRDCGNFPGLGAGWYRAAVKLPEENARLLSALEEVVHGG